MNKCDLPALITALGGRQALQDLLGVGRARSATIWHAGSCRAMPTRRSAPRSKRAAIMSTREASPSSAAAMARGTAGAACC